MGMNEYELGTGWYRRWTKQAFGWTLLAVLALFCLIGVFTVFFDIVLLKIGCIYVYFAMFLETLLLYFTYARLRVKGLGVILFGITGAVGIPMDLYFEWIAERNLSSPSGAVGWFIAFFLMGLSADLSLWLLRPEENEGTAMTVSATIFSETVIVVNTIALGLFYTNPGWPRDFLKFGYFLIPYAIITGALGGYIGWHLADDLSSFLKKAFKL